MKFKKIGQIFNTNDLPDGIGTTEFAQSPQSLVIEDKLRVYFSTRTRDEKGEYLSHITFVDFDSKFKIIGYSSEEVIAKGKLGCYDEHGIFPFHPFRLNDRLYALLTGWNRRVSVPVDTGIGLGVSVDNGQTFTRYGDGPVLAQGIQEPFLVGDGFIVQRDDLHYMFYIFGVRWLAETDKEPVSRVYKIGYATSNDLLNWRTNNGLQIIGDALNENECQALPTVIYHNEIYHMVFCFREAIDFRKNERNGYRLGYAYSKDLLHWERNDDMLNIKIELDKNNWDSKMLCYPHLFRFNDKVYLLYNGNEFGKYGFGLAELING